MPLRFASEAWPRAGLGEPRSASNANKPASSWALKQGRKKCSKHGCDRGTSTVDMVLSQLDAYHAGRQLQHLQLWTSVVLAQRQERGQPGVELVVRYGYEAFAGFHVMQLITECIPLLLFSDPKAVPSASPWNYVKMAT